MSISSNVSQHGGNTIVISTGDSNYVWNDKNNDGVVNEGDLIVRTKQRHAEVTTWVVGQDEGLHAWGDPHLDNFTLTNDAKQTLTVALQAAFDDAKEDGQLDNQGCLVDIDQALPSGDEGESIFDFHGNVCLALTDGTRLEFYVAKLGDVAFTENVDLEVLDENGSPLVLTIGEIWEGNGGEGQSGVKVTTNNDGEQAVKRTEAENLHVFHEYEGANVINGVVMYGNKVGTRDYAHVVKVDGSLDTRHGEITLESMRFRDARYREELMSEAMQLYGQENDEEESEEEKRAINSADTVATASVAASN